MIEKSPFNYAKVHMIADKILHFLLMPLLCTTGCTPYIPTRAEPQIVKSTPPLIQKPAVKRANYTALKTLPPFKDIPTNNSLTIVIDPGHGGEDFGTHSNSRPRYQEKFLNLSTSFLVKGYLEQLGYKVVMTRKDDTFISLDERAHFANSQKPRIFVSVHYNSAPSVEAEGIEVFYYRSEENNTRSNHSKKLAQAILNRVIANTNAKSRGVKHGNLSVIRNTNMPAVLIEGGFMTSDKEMEKIKEPKYIKKIAWGIAKGIDDWIKQG